MVGCSQPGILSPDPPCYVYPRINRGVLSLGSSSFLFTVIFVCDTRRDIFSVSCDAPVNPGVLPS